MRLTRRASGAAVLVVVIGSMTASAGKAAAVHTTRVDVSTGGTVANASTDSSGIAMAAGGLLVAFSSSATNLVPGDTNGTRDVFVHNTRTGVTTRADLGPGGVQANGDSFGPVAISGDGRPRHGQDRSRRGRRHTRRPLAGVRLPVDEPRLAERPRPHPHLPARPAVLRPLWSRTLRPSGRRGILIATFGGSADVHAERGEYVCEPGRDRAHDVCRG